MYGEIKEFSANDTTKSKKKYKDDQLSKLGAPPLKAMKIPFKMKMGMINFQKKKAESELKHLKESGVVVSKASTNNLIKKNRKNKDKSIRKSEKRNISYGDTGIDHHSVKNGVLRINKKMLQRRK